MKKSKQTIDESVEKIKFMMNYDSLRTLIENTNEVTGKEINKAIKGLDDQLSGDYLEGDSADMEDALDIVKNLSGKTYKGKDAIGVLISGYNRYTKGDLIDDVNTKLKNLDFNGMEFQDELIKLLQPKAPESTTQPTQTSSQNWYPPCEGGVNKFGCMSDSIKSIQGALGVTQDGMYGPETKSRLSKFGVDTFNDSDVPNILKTIKPEKISTIRPTGLTNDGGKLTTQTSNPNIKKQTNPITSKPIQTKSNIGTPKEKLNLSNIANPYPNVSSARQTEIGNLVKKGMFGRNRIPKYLKGKLTQDELKYADDLLTKLNK